MVKFICLSACKGLIATGHIFPLRMKLLVNCLAVSEDDRSLQETHAFPRTNTSRPRKGL